jgi:AmmeMemoRadiSam system protein A
MGAAETATLSLAGQQCLLQTARGAIRGWLDGRALALDLEGALPELLRPRGAFVSLKRRGGGELRGCVGRAAATEPLLALVARLAVAAASEDPRFEPVTFEELPSLSVQVSVLGPLLPVQPAEVQVGLHGLLVSHLGRQGLLLPQVPWQQGWDRELFLDWTCRKAGLPADAWQQGATVYRFEAEVFGE